jgi:transcriptional regulator with GAF, ATPase, and Fis domain
VSGFLTTVALAEVVSRTWSREGFVTLEEIEIPVAPSSTSTALPSYRGQHGIVGQSRSITEMIRDVEVVAGTRSTVLITGETGTGKELVARAIHRLSARRRMPFVTVNCAAIPETLIESELFGHVKGAFTDATSAKKGKFLLAEGGSIFLDEIGKMPLALQAKLLRVLQELEIEPLGAERTVKVDVRVVAATNRDLRELVREGQFLADLFYRLHVVPIAVPPLRDRLDDVPMLAAYFINKHAIRCGKAIEAVDDSVMATLLNHLWPGNVRELENTIERAVVLATGATITDDSVIIDAARVSKSWCAPSIDLRQNVEWIERETIRRALDASTAKGEAARLMGISARTLSYYLSKYPQITRERLSS